MSEIHLRLQPKRSNNQKVRLSQRMRAKGRPETEIKRVVWHKENSPTKGKL